jgi:outer membrane protein assembly factor BamB
VVDLMPVRLLLVTLAGWINDRQEEAAAHLVEENRPGRRRAGAWAAIVLASVAIAPSHVGLVAQDDPATYVAAGDWRQWGGPRRNFTSDTVGLADRWPDDGPPVRWSRALGPGHSSIVVDQGRLFTMYRPGGERPGQGPWESRESVIALDSTTGETIWEYPYDSAPLDFSYGAGPHATPLVVGERLFAAGTNKELHAFDKATGRRIWSHDLVAEFGAPPTLVRPTVKAGYACSPVAYKDTIILTVGGRGQAVMAFRQDDGSVAWRSGDFLLAHAAPLLIDVDGQIQLVVVGGETINGLDPETGELLWSHPHDTLDDMNNSMPVWGADHVLFVSSAFDGGSRALRVTRDGDGTHVEELWFTNRLQVMFSNAVRIGDYVYATSGAFGPAFLTGIHVMTGELAWQERGFGRSSLLLADGKAIILDEDGALSLARLSPERLQLLSSVHLFDTTAWTVPALVGTTLYARDRERIVALDLGG